MPKNNKQSSVGDMEPDELNEYKKLALEFVDRMETIENEIATLNEDKKQLKEDFKEKIDLKTLMQVIRVLKVESSVVHKDTFEVIKEALVDKSQ